MNRTSISKKIVESRLAGSKIKAEEKQSEQMTLAFGKMDRNEQAYLLEELRDQMDLASKNLDFELAAELRDRISHLRQIRGKKKHRF